MRCSQQNHNAKANIDVVRYCQVNELGNLNVEMSAAFWRENWGLVGG